MIMNIILIIILTDLQIQLQIQKDTNYACKTYNQKYNINDIPAPLVS